MQTVVSRLRTALDEDVIHRGPAGYCLAVDPEAVDAGRFTALCGRAAVCAPEDAATLLDEALGLWRGPAYVEFADRDFARAEAARLDELRFAAREDRARAALALEDFESAVTDLESLVEQQPLREQARALLMTVLFRAGRQSEALDRFEELRKVLHEELGLDPSPALVDLHRRILGHRLPETAAKPAATAPPPAWPSRDTAFIGREDESALLLRAVREHRLVTVTGPGGVGKTRLVAEAFPAVCGVSARPGAVIALGEVSPGAVSTRLTTELRLGPGPEAPREAVLEHLARTPLVLVLDGCEHVLDEVRDLAAAVLRSCPQVHLLITSRVRLGLTDENLLPLAPLSVPDPDGVPTPDATSAAERLLIDRIRRLQPAFAPARRSGVTELCRRLDGLPLALELVAPQVAALGPEPVLERIGTGIDLTGPRAFGGPTTLRWVIDRSLSLLDAEDLRLLMRLAAFSDTFDLESLDGIGSVWTGAAPEVPSHPAHVILTRLVEASLVTAVPHGATSRYRLLGIVRAAAIGRADEAGQLDDILAAHAEWAARSAEACAAQAIGPSGADAYARLAALRTELADVLRWSLDHARADIATRIVGALGLCSHLFPGRELSALAARMAASPPGPPTPATALALGASAFSAVERSDSVAAEALGHRALAAARTPNECYLALLDLSLAALYSGRRDDARQRFERMLTIPGLPDAYRADVHASLALVAATLGDQDQAEFHAAAAREAGERSGAPAHSAFALYATGEVLLTTAPDAAPDVLREAAARADAASADHVGTVARLALLSALVRGDETEAARNLALELLDPLRQGTCWPYLWTCLRIVAELLARTGHPADAELVLAAAETNPTAPPPAGDDIERHLRLRREIAEELGAGAAARIDVLAGLLPRSEIAERAHDRVQRLKPRLRWRTPPAPGTLGQRPPDDAS